MITDYCVKKFDSEDLLNECVRQMLRDDWQPLGQAMPYVEHYTHAEGNYIVSDTYFVQTMVKVGKSD